MSILNNEYNKTIKTHSPVRNPQQIQAKKMIALNIYPVK